MSEQFEYYFKDRSINAAKALMMSDIRNNVLRGNELEILIGNLQAENLLLDKAFNPRGGVEQWDEDYLEFLQLGFVSDYFSEPYLRHFGEVAEHVFTRKRRKRRVMVGAIAAVLLAVIALSCLFARNLREKKGVVDYGHIGQTYARSTPATGSAYQLG